MGAEPPTFIPISGFYSLGGVLFRAGGEAYVLKSVKLRGGIWFLRQSRSLHYANDPGQLLLYCLPHLERMVKYLIMPRKDESRTVYTTEMGRVCPGCGQPTAKCICHQKKGARPVGDGVVRVALDRKGRGGKTVTLISGIASPEDDLKTLASELKRRCGTGGAVKDGVIEIQGDHRDTIMEFLKEKAIRNVKRAGGD